MAVAGGATLGNARATLLGGGPGGGLGGPGDP
jgi:hypothetical protein